VAGAIREDFARIVALARSKLTQVEVTEELDSDRAILAIRGLFGDYRIFIKETISHKGRRYAFYILKGDRVVLGLDNHPDRQALRLKYGRDFVFHLTELVSHRHGLDKVTLELTEEWTAERFLTEIETLVAEL
jgi:hypothetical protein